MYLMTPLRLGCTIRLLLLAVLPVTAQAVATNETVHAFDMATPGYQYRFPHDHGAHERFRTEWWYYTGHVVAADGHRFGFELTFFRRGMPPDQVQTLPSRWSIQQLYLAHFALTDLDAGRFYYADKVSREGLGKAGADTDRLHVWVDRWSLLTNDPAASSHQLQAATDSVAINLTVIPKKPPVIHGHDGLSRKGADPGQASHYYSLTHLATEGQIRVGTETFAVTGLSWMDHEFGSADLGLNVVGWDWFSLQLSDSTELMWYSLRRADGSRKDMWQPKQPASEVVATRSLRLSTAAFISHLLGRRAPGEALDLHADRLNIVAPAADRHGEAAPLAQDDADRADMRCLVGERKVGVRQAPRLGIDDQVLADATPGEGKDVLAVDVATGAHAQLAENAAVEVEQHLGVRGIDRPIGIELRKVRGQLWAMTSRTVRATRVSRVSSSSSSAKMLGMERKISLMVTIPINSSSSTTGNRRISLSAMRLYASIKAVSGAMIIGFSVMKSCTCDLWCRIVTSYPIRAYASLA